MSRRDESEDFRFRSFGGFAGCFCAAGFFGKRDQRNGIAVRVRNVQSFFVIAESDAFRTRSGQGVLGETNVDALDLLIRRCVNHRDAVRIGVRDKKPRAFGIRNHRGWMPIDRNVFPHDTLAAERNNRDRGIIPARDVGAHIFAASENDYSVGINVFAQLPGVVQIHSLHFSGSAEIADDRHTVAQVVSRDQHGAVGRYLEARGIESGLSFVVVFRRNFAWLADFK